MDNTKFPTEITAEEILSELEKRFSYRDTIPEGAVTVENVASAINRSRSSALRAMRKLVDDGAYRKDKIVYKGKVINVYYKTDK